MTKRTNKTYINFASGWKSKNNPDTIISCKNDPKRTGIKLLAVDVDSGDQIEIKSFFAKANENTPRKSKTVRVPDWIFTFVPEEQE